MHIENYLLFIGASIILCIVPGPDMIFMLSRTIAQGRRAGVAAAVGINLGGYVHLVASVLGLSAILATSALAFSIVKWLGAAYLIYIGIQSLLSKQSPVSINGNEQKKYSAIFWQGFLSDVLNPKVAIFFLAFLPQFVDTTNDHPVWTQLLILGLTVNMVAIVINLLLVYSSSWVTKSLRQNPGTALWLNKVMGGVFIALGLRLATEKI